MTETSTDCRSETGITVGLVDSLISICRVLAARDLSAHEVQEALKDLRNDGDVVDIITPARTWTPGDCRMVGDRLVPIPPPATRATGRTKAAAKLLHQTWPVIGDPEAVVRLELRPGQGDQRELIVSFVTPVAVARKYTAVEVGFRAGPGPVVTSFHLGWAKLLVAAEQVAEIAWLVVMTAGEVRCEVNLEGPAAELLDRPLAVSMLISRDREITEYQSQIHIGD